MPTCHLCDQPTSAEVLSESGWVDPAVISRLKENNPHWRREDGACPACTQQLMKPLLL